MSIQGSINSILGSAAATTVLGTHLYQQTPAFKKMTELKNINQQLSAKEKQVQGIAEDIIAQNPDAKLKDLDLSSYDQDIIEKGQEDLALKKRLFEVDPTPENYRQYKNTQKAFENFQKKRQPAFDDSQGLLANDRSLKQINSAMRIKDTMNRMRGLYNE